MYLNRSRASKKEDGGNYWVCCSSVLVQNTRSTCHHRKFGLQQRQKLRWHWEGLNPTEGVWHFMGPQAVHLLSSGLSFLPSLAISGFVAL